MDLKIGRKIMELRKAKGMTQEQLAGALGISSPAVSKWETESSYPDITLLCPLARVLDTDVDTLLQFEETLSNEEAVGKINTVVETARKKGVEAGEEELQKILRQYPTNVVLKFNAASALTAFEMFFPLTSEEKKERWKEQRRELFQYVYESRTSGYWQNAVIMLATQALAEDKLEEAENLLKELPEHIVDSTFLWANLYGKKGEIENAVIVVQKRLFTLVRQVQECLICLMGEKMEPDVGKAMEICEISRKMDELFACSGGMSDGIYLELYMRAGQKEKAIDSLCHFVDAYLGTVKLPKPLLFDKALKTKSEDTAVSKELRQLLLNALEGDEMFQEMKEDVRVKEAIEKIKKSIETE